MPVGEDQKQHLELARDIGGAFNRKFAEDFFPLPEPLIMGEAARIMSLRDGTKKMSKSDPSDMSRINLTDSADAIAMKLQKAKSDAFSGLTVDPEGRPEATNLLTIYAALSDQPLADVATAFHAATFSSFKAELTALAVAKLVPIADEMRRLLQDPAHIDALLTAGAERAAAIAAPVLDEVRDRVGFLAPARR